MTAEILRRAAALMRERAEYADDAPWVAEIHDDGRAWINVPDERHALSMHGSPSTARHIASWHPAVALAVADLLDDGAAYFEFMAREYPDVPATDFGKFFLAIARAYLGESS